MMRSSLLEVLHEDYIRTARAKGVYDNLVMRRHALRNALLPVVTVIGLEFAFLIGGLVVTEQVFNLNGIGKLFVETARGDFTLIQGLVMLIATFFVLVNLVVDLLYGCARSAHPVPEVPWQPLPPPPRSRDAAQAAVTRCGPSPRPSRSAWSGS